MTFYHFTCAHSAPLIMQAGVVKPLGQLGKLAGRLPPERHWMLDIAWFTDLEDPDREGLGLTSVTLQCDRTEWRVTVSDPSTLVPWSQFARTRRIPSVQRQDLERYGRPAHWWVSEEPVPVTGCCNLREAS